MLLLLADPRPIGPGCVEGPAPADAEALARSIGSDAEFDATAPAAEIIGGIPSRRMDLMLSVAVQVVESIDFHSRRPGISGSATSISGSYKPVGPRLQAASVWCEPPGAATLLMDNARWLTPRRCHARNRDIRGHPGLWGTRAS